MIDPRRFSTVHGMRYLEFRCAVVEDSVRCTNRHLEPVINKEEAETIADLGHICGTCEQKGYAWYTRLLGTADEKGDLIQSLATDPVGAKTDEFRSGQTFVVKNDKLADVATGFSVNSTQKEKGNKGSNALKGWSAVREYPEYGDILMLRSDEAKDPQAAMVERKQRTIVGLANAPKKDDPFEGMFD